MTTSIPSTIIAANEAELATAAAAHLLARIEQNIGESAICLTGGSSPKQLYELLAKPPWRNRIPWRRTHWFIGDDRFVSHDDPLSNIGMARRAFLDACAPPANVHPIETGASSIELAAELYEKELRGFAERHCTGGAPLFDLVLLGVGPDGHVASLFPDYPAVDETTRWVVGVPKANVAPFVPRVSLTLPCLAMCHEMLFIACGREKRGILTRVFAHEDLPAARAGSANGETIWMLDEAAAPPGIRPA